MQIAAVIVPLILGILSLLLGQDRNWDLLNYHLYTPFAFWNDKLQIDLAPAGMQSYFNPALDLFHYALITGLPSRATGFLLGLIHGSNFVLILLIARKVLTGLPDEDRFRLPVLLAIAGVLTANFLAGLGNTMGDNITALFCLGALLFVLDAARRLRSGPGVPRAAAALGGVLIGLGTGLKLTSGIYAVALCVTLLLVRGGFRQRFATATIFGVGVLAGFALTGGAWHFEMWRTWGNPFFPQFSALFPNPLVAPVGVVDTAWFPANLLEALLWPFVFSLDATRVGQLPLRQVIWAVAYAVFWLWIATTLVRRRRRPRDLQPGPTLAYTADAGTVLITFIALAYTLWMLVFSIYRYLVPVELLLPLLLFVLLRDAFRHDRARKLTAWLLLPCTAIVVAGGVRNWGHEGWLDPPFRAELPALDDPERTTVLIAVGDPPLAWIATLFPPSVAFAQVDTNFPVTPLYHRRIHDTIRQRGGPVFALFHAHHNPRTEQVARLQRIAQVLRLDRSASGCRWLDTATRRFRLRAVVEPVESGAAGPSCRLALRQQDRRDLDAENTELSRQIANRLAPHGFRLDTGRCVTKRAYVGDGAKPFSWCPVVRSAFE